MLQHFPLAYLKHLRVPLSLAFDTPTFLPLIHSAYVFVLPFVWGAVSLNTLAMAPTTPLNPDIFPHFLGVDSGFPHHIFLSLAKLMGVKPFKQKSLFSLLFSVILHKMRVSYSPLLSFSRRRLRENDNSGIGEGGGESLQMREQRINGVFSF